MTRDTAYVSKTEVEKRDGSGSFTVYGYDDRFKAQQAKAKARRLQELAHQLDVFRAQVKRDLHSADPQVRATALAVALIAETYERVGSPRAAAGGHYGVTTWCAGHVQIRGGTAVIRYVGKAGVTQAKHVTTPSLLRVLASAVKGKPRAAPVVGVPASAVNAYLRKFRITAKDIRGFAANDEMRKRLAGIRARGPRLAWGTAGATRQLRTEFAEALRDTAAVIGHTPSVLRKQYLVPALEDMYLRTGKAVARLDHRARDAARGPSRP